MTAPLAQFLNSFEDAVWFRPEDVMRIEEKKTRHGDRLLVSFHEGRELWLLDCELNRKLLGIA